MKKLLSITMAMMLMLSMASSVRSEETLKYGTASLSFAEYWAGELGVDSDTLQASSETPDSEGNLDAGGLDAVSRATTKHGIFRQQFGYDVYVNGELVVSKQDVEKDGKTVTEFVTDPAVKVSLKADSDYIGLKDEEMQTAANDRGLYTEDLAKSFMHEGKEYKIVSYTVEKMKNIPVAVPADKVEEAVEKYGFKEDASIHAETHGLKVLGENGFGPRNVKNVSDDKALVLDHIKTVYNTRYGSNAEAYIYFKKANGDELTQEEFIDYALHFRTARIDYYGDDSTYSKLLHSYGTKHSADSWWSDHHGTRIDVGINYGFKRFEGSGAGYYTITLIANDYSDIVANVHFLPDYTGKVEIKISENKLSVQADDAGILEGALYSVSSGKGKEAVKLVSEEALTGSEITLPAGVEKGKEYDVNIIFANYAPIKVKVVAE